MGIIGETVVLADWGKSALLLKMRKQIHAIENFGNPERRWMSNERCA